MMAKQKPAATPKKSERIIVFDIIRITAILLVILNHAYNYLLMGDGGATYHLLLQYLGRLGVPMFLMITGIFQLRKGFDKDDEVISFWRSRALKLYLQTVAWIIVMFVVDGFLLHITNRTAPTDLAKEMLFLAPIPSEPQMWYMPVIIGVYIALPFVAKLLHTYSLRVFLVPVGLLLAGSILIPFVNDAMLTLAWITETERLNWLTDTSFFGGYFAIYLLAGYAIVWKKWLAKINPAILILILTAAACAGVSYQTWLGADDVWYNSVFVLIGGVTLFALLYRLLSNFRPTKTIRSVIQKLSSASFTVYFIHYMIIHTTMLIAPLTRGSFKNAVILFLTTSVISFAMALFMKWLWGLFYGLIVANRRIRASNHH
jgi:peptidoglycan/LPS O-acetylase OafA/YrhL